MKKASLAAAFAASLCLCPVSLCLAAEGAPVDEARVAEEQLLGAADEDAAFLAYQPFTREIASSVVVSTSLEQALADSVVLSDEEARFLADQPFAREIASTVVVSTPLDQALAGSGMPADEARVAEEQLLGAADDARPRPLDAEAQLAGLVPRGHHQQVAGLAAAVPDEHPLP